MALRGCPRAMSILGSMRLAVGVRQPSFGIFSTSLQTTYRFGVPTSVRLAGAGVDIDASFTSMQALLR